LREARHFAHRPIGTIVRVPPSSPLAASRSGIFRDSRCRMTPASSELALGEIRYSLLSPLDIIRRAARHNCTRTLALQQQPSSSYRLALTQYGAARIGSFFQKQIQLSFARPLAMQSHLLGQALAPKTSRRIRSRALKRRPLALRSASRHLGTCEVRLDRPSPLLSPSFSTQYSQSAAKHPRPADEG